MKHTTSTLILKNKFAVVILVTIFLSMFGFLNKNSIPENLLKHAQNLKKHFEFELPVWNYQTSCDETHNHRLECKACNTKVWSFSVIIFSWITFQLRRIFSATPSPYLEWFYLWTVPHDCCFSQTCGTVLARTGAGVLCLWTWDHQRRGVPQLWDCWGGLSWWWFMTLSTLLTGPETGLETERCSLMMREPTPHYWGVILIQLENCSTLL